MYDSAAQHLVRISDLSTANTSPFNLATSLEIIDSFVNGNIVPMHKSTPIFFIAKIYQLLSPVLASRLLRLSSFDHAPCRRSEGWSWRPRQNVSTMPSGSGSFFVRTIKTRIAVATQGMTEPTMTIG